MVGKVGKVVQVRGSEEVIVGRWRVPAAANPQPAPLSNPSQGVTGCQVFSVRQCQGQVVAVSHVDATS